MSETRPTVYDLYCGLGGWAEGFLSEGWRVIGFDIEAHDYGTGGYPGELILRDVRSIHGSELKDADCIVGSSPCQEFSYRAMPWKRAKALPPPYLGMELFQAQFRIQREACEAAGRYIPLIVENVRGAQKWIGRARANFGSYYLWGDVGMVGRRVVAIREGCMQVGVSVTPVKAAKVPGFRFNGNGGSFQSASVSQKCNPDGTEHGAGSWFAIADSKNRGSRSARGKVYPTHPVLGLDRIAEETEENSSATKNTGGSWFNIAHNTTSGKGMNPDGREAMALRGVKGFTPNGEPLGKNTLGRKYGSKSAKRKAASALIAKIPFPLAQHIARVFKP